MNFNKAEINSIFKLIIEEIYNIDRDSSINVFLCGTNPSNPQSIRSTLNTVLGRNPIFNIVYPEYIFSPLTKKRNKNILDLEKDLAKYVDAIILPLEGLGTICELGVFASNKKLLPKIIILNDKKFNKYKSFVNIGPIDLIKRNDKTKNNLIYYHSQISEDTIKKINKRLYSIKREHPFHNYSLDNLFGFSRFLLYVIALFQPISLEHLSQYLAFAHRKLAKQFIEPSIQILNKKNLVEFYYNHEEKRQQYILSDSGHKYFFEKILERFNIKKRYATIRNIIINKKLVKGKFKLGKELKFLESLSREEA